MGQQTLAIEPVPDNERRVEPAIYAVVDPRTDPYSRAGAMDLLLLGCGRVGRAVADLVLRRADHLQERYGVAARWVALGDSSGFLFDPQGLHPTVVAEACRAKAAGHPLRSLPGASAGDAEPMVERALACRLSRPVLVDVSDGDGDAAAAYHAALRSGCDVVTANKKPFAGAEFAALRAEARAHARILRGEATVGAGLPVLATLEHLLASGDEVRRIEGCFSGTLGFVLGGLEAGRGLVEVVEDAVERGLAEPDPVADLCGADVGRKALILGRLSGLLDDPEQVELEGLVPGSLAGLDPEALRQRLAALDAPLRWRLEAARCQGRRLRYVATIERGRARVGLVEVPSDSPLAALESTDNIAVFHTARYCERPLAVSGPGAGVEVTAMGVFADLVHVAAERR